DVTSKYTRRGEEEYQKYASYIQNIVNAKQGNYMVFGPSYKFLEDIYSRYDQLHDDVDIIIQQQNMTEQEREEFLSEFEKKRDKSMVAFCTLGGIFSEGIDLVGGKLIGSIILGAGLPQVGNERKLMSDFFDEEGKNGFEYAYLYPGMNKVIQAAGRLIRTKDDVGVIALLDERFRFSTYRKTFPREWNDASFTTVDDISLKLTNFWGKKP
nr:ATP-dependent DNA helicase [Pseudobutyrivibrio sp.]